MLKWIHKNLPRAKIGLPARWRSPARGFALIPASFSLRLHDKRGFTVLELFIVIFLMTVVTAIVLASYPDFSRQTSIERDAQLLALAFRDAETRAISVYEAGAAFDNNFGVHVETTSEQARRQYILFADVNSTPLYYDSGEELRIGTLSSRTRIGKICSALRDGNPANDDCALSCLSITFERPAPVVSVQGASGGGGCTAPSALTEGDFEIEIESDNGALRRCVVVWTTGAVSVESNAC